MSALRFFLPLTVFAAFFTHGRSQVVLTPNKITLYHDASQLSQKGILRFAEKKAQFISALELRPASIQAFESGEYKIQYMKFLEDTIISLLPVTDWLDVLMANRGKTVTVVYEIGTEFDEISGEVKLVDRSGGLLMLHKSGAGDFFIPVNQVRQVVVENNANSLVEKKTSRKLIEVGVDKDLPFAPLELTGILDSIRWTPVCRLKLETERSARYTLTAVIENDRLSLQDMEVELAAAELSAGGGAGAQSDRYKLGKLTLRKGEKLFLDLSTTRTEYEQRYDCLLPWTGIGPAEGSEAFPARNLLKLSSPIVPAPNCTDLVIQNSSGHQVAAVPAGDGAVQEIVMGNDPRVKVTFQETIEKQTGKKVKVGEMMYDQFRVKGKITAVNMKAEGVSIRITREICGELKGGEQALVTETGKPNRKFASWVSLLQSSGTKTIEYQYDALVPAAE